MGSLCPPTVRMSRYPSAHGHTPSYRSVGSMPTYPSALGARDTTDLGLGLGSRSGAGLSAAMDREFSSLTSSLNTDPLLKYSDPLAKSTGATSYQASSYSSKQTSSSADGGVPHISSTSDSTYRSRAVGDSGIPHTSYSHSSNSFDSDRPYGN